MIYDNGYNNLLTKDPLFQDTPQSTIEKTVSSNLTSGELIGNLKMIDGFMQSGGFVDSSIGWKIEHNGSAEFNNEITAKRLTLNNFYKDDDSSIVYTGTWEQQNVSVLMGGTRTVSLLVNDYFTITFTGTSIGLFFEKASDLGKVEISIDGIAIETVDLYASQLWTREIVFQKTDLSNSEHTLVATIKDKNVLSSSEGAGFGGYTTFPHTGIKMEQLSCILYTYSTSLLTDANGYKATVIGYLSGYSVYHIVGLRLSESVMSDATATDPKLAWRTTEVYLYNGAPDTTYSVTITLLMSKL